jgi:hypothetical protein
MGLRYLDISFPDRATMTLYIYVAQFLSSLRYYISDFIRNTRGIIFFKLIIIIILFFFLINLECGRLK